LIDGGKTFLPLRVARRGCLENGFVYQADLLQ
jgi:hypothetical protein